MPMRRRSGCSSRSPSRLISRPSMKTCAGIGPFQPVQAADQRRLAGAAAADDAEDLALAHRQRNAVQRGRCAEAALEIGEADDIFQRLRKLRCRRSEISWIHGHSCRVDPQNA